MVSSELNRFHWIAAAFTVVATLFIGACAQDVGDIDRTQPNAMLKSDFEGVWYYKPTVIDVPAHMDYSFVGYTTWQGMDKIRWDIREEFLIAYRSYEYRPGTDETAGEVVEGNTRYAPTFEEGVDPESYKGEPVAAFRITSHFDVQRRYNAATGEQANVIEENTVDLPWNERRYMRVDWSENLVNNLDFLIDMNAVRNTTYFVQEQEGGPDAFYKETRTVLEGGEEGQELGYFDFVNRVSLEPNLWDCWYYSRNCIPGEVSLRMSFYKLEDLERDYEPAVYDDRMMNKFGYFRTERLVYDRREGFTDTQRIFFANRFDIWENDYKRDDSGEYLRDADGRRIPTPMSERTPKPIVYYLSPNVDEPIETGAMKMAEDYNRAFIQAIAAAKGIEPEQVTELLKTSDKYNPEGAMFVMCHNPVQSDDPGICDPRPIWAKTTTSTGEPEPFRVRLGDLRYNLLWVVETPQAAGPLGFGPMATDPETGEAVSAVSMIYGGGLDVYAQHGVDILKLINGDFTEEQLRGADDLREYLEERRRADLDPRAAMNSEMLQKLESMHGDGLNLLDDRMRTKLEIIEQEGREVFGTDVLQHKAILDRFERAGWDKRLLDSEMLGAMTKGTQFDTSTMTDQQLNDLLEKVSPIHLTDVLKRRGDWQRRLQRQNIYMPVAMDDAVAGAAFRFEGNKDYDDIWNTIRQEIFYGVATHELGHNVGLRHNFQGSYDAINYFDKYWELRRENLPQGTPRSIADYFNYSAINLTETQRQEGMHDYQYSSIMDYHGRFNSDWKGLGKYDDAAILFAYTFGTYEDLETSHSGPIPQEPGYVEVFRNLPQSAANVMRAYDTRRSPAERALLENYHYTTILNLLGGDPSRLQDRAIARYSRLEPFIEARDPNRDVEVPYMFCGDEIANALISCAPFDIGADPLELTMHAAQNYFTYYPLTHFRRERVNFDQLSALNRSYRTARSFLTTYQQWLLGYQEVDDDLLNILYQFASFQGFNHLTRMMTLPRYGTYRRDASTGQYEWARYEQDAQGTERTVKMGDGRRLRSLYDAQSGYYYFDRLLEIGHFWDWIGALFVVVEPIARTVAADTAADVEAYTVPYNIIFEDEVTQIFNGVLTKEYGTFNPRVKADGTVVFPPHATFQIDEETRLDPANGQSVESYFEGTEPLELVTNLTQDRYASLYGIALLNELYSQRYVDQARVFKIGHGDELKVQPESGYEIFSFTDPRTGLAYGTVRPIGGSQEDPTLGEQLVQTGAEAAELYTLDPSNFEYERELTNTVETINMLVDMIEVYGRTHL